MEDGCQKLLSGSQERCRCAEKELEKVDIQDEVTDEVCDVCGAIWSSNTDLTEDSLPVRDFRSAETPSLIMKRSVWHVRNVERMSC